MTASQKTALVLGATGQQGGAVTRELLASGWRVRALVRDQGKTGAQLLRGLGVELREGDLDNPASLTEAMRNVDGVFSVQTDSTEEVHQGKAVADSAKATGVSHLVYASVSGANRPIGVGSFAAKGEIERYIRSLELPATILRPVMFMENYRFLARLVDGSIHLPSLADPATRTQAIAVQDIGIFAAIALNEPALYVGKTLEIAGDELSFSQIAEALRRRFEHPVIYQSGTPEEEQHLAGARKATAFFAREGYRGDIASLRRIHPQLLSFERWLAQTDLLL
jgi:uncharacterized protein YbjT (DUF2867 family)